MTSSLLVRDQLLATAYSGPVRKLDQPPAEDPVLAWERTFRKYPADTAIGRRVRKGVARTWLRDMAAAEDEVRQRQSQHALIADRIRRRQAEHELNIQHLVRFGVTLDQRQAFREVLEEVEQSGRLTIREAADRAHKCAQRNGESSVGGAERSSVIA